MLKALLIDLDGVIYQAEELIPGAEKTLEWLRAEQIPHLFVTNTTSRPRSAIVEKLANLGVEVSPDQILTPAVAVSFWLEEKKPESIALFLPDATREELAPFRKLEARIESQATAVIVGDLGAGWGFPELNRAFRLLMANPDSQLVALGMTRYWRTADGLQLDVGPFVKALEFASERKALVFGKPACMFFQQALQRLGVQPSEALMVGDDIRGDVGGAQACGLKGALVRTGKFQKSDLEGDIVPDVVLTSFADLPAHWNSLL